MRLLEVSNFIGSEKVSRVLSHTCNALLLKFVTHTCSGEYLLKDLFKDLKIDLLEKFLGQFIKLSPANKVARCRPTI